MEKEKIIIEAPFENGAGKRGASLGPSALYHEAWNLQAHQITEAAWETVEDFNDIAVRPVHYPFSKHIEGVIKATKATAMLVEKTIANHKKPIILSGDHSNAIGSVTGVKQHFPNTRLGVIWIDAHLDLHSPFTTPSGNIHGMAMNALIGDDNTVCQKNQPDADTIKQWHLLKSCGPSQISPKIQPSDLVYIGIRDYEPEEIQLAEHHGIKLFRPEAVKELGMNAILQEALNYLSACDHLYISFDVDSMDPGISRGTGTPVPDGLSLEDAALVFKTLLNNPKTVAFEITEINPLLDSENAMAKAVVQLLDAAW